jgi:hypothetical protein
VIATDKLYLQLSNIIKKYDGALDSIVDKTNISKTTLWRWSNQTNVKLPDPNKVLRLLAKESNLTNVRDIANYFGGEIEMFLKASLPSLYDKDNYRASVYDEMEDFYTFVIYSVISTKRGANEEDLIKIVGNLSARKAGLTIDEITDDLVNAHGMIAVKRINELYKRKRIKIEEDGSYSPTDLNCFIPIDRFTKFAPDMLANFIKPEEFQYGLNGVFCSMDSIPKKVAAEIAQETKEFFKKIKNKMKDSSSADGVPFMTFNLAETMWFNSMDQSPEVKEVQ